jgi:4-hydroxybenzoate polyprenyltransferase
MSVIIGMTAICGAYLATPGFAGVSRFVPIFLAEMAIAAGGFALNDILDVRRDEGTAWKPLATGRITIAAARWIFRTMLAAGLLLSLCLGARTFGLCCVQVMTIYAYSSVKRRYGLIANFVTAALCSSGFIYGAFASECLGRAWLPAILAFEFVVAREMVKDIMDMEQDARSGLPTLPLRHGMERTLMWVAAIVSLSIATSMLPLFRYAFGPIYTILMLFVNAALSAVTIGIVVRPSPVSIGYFLNVSAGAFLFVFLACAF